MPSGRGTAYSYAEGLYRPDLRQGLQLQGTLLGLAHYQAPYGLMSACEI
jgi:hypothetical protein